METFYPVFWVNDLGKNAAVKPTTAQEYPGVQRPTILVFEEYRKHWSDKGREPEAEPLQTIIKRLEPQIKGYYASYMEVLSTVGEYRIRRAAVLHPNLFTNEEKRALVGVYVTWLAGGRTNRYHEVVIDNGSITQTVPINAVGMENTENGHTRKGEKDPPNWFSGRSSLN